jgi:hypothetical protein
MDDFHARAIKNFRARHEGQIEENAARILEHIGYVLKRVSDGRPETVDMYAADIEASIKRIRASVTALESVREALAILETSDGPVWHDDWEESGRDVHGNLLLKHKPTEGLYYVIPEEER